MPADLPPRGIQDGTWLHRLGCMLAQEATVIIVGHEAYLHALVSVGYRQPALARHLPDLGLAVCAYREPEMPQLLLAQHVEHVGLVFLPIRSLLQAIDVVQQGDARIVARCQELCAHLLHVMQQEAETDLPVAGQARVGRPSPAVLGDEIIHHTGLELGPVIYHV